MSVKRNIANFRYAWAHFIRQRVMDAPDLGVSFALTGTVARLVLLALSLGYRRIGFVGVDLGATPYFWLEDRPSRGKPPLKSRRQFARPYRPAWCDRATLLSRQMYSICCRKSGKPSPALPFSRLTRQTDQA